MQSPSPTTSSSNSPLSPTPSALIRRGKKMSGKNERRVSLGLAGSLLILLSLVLIILAGVILASYHFGHLTFASDLFSAAPWISIAAGIVTLAAGLLAVYLARKKTDPSRAFRTLSLVLFLGFLLCLAAAALCMLLRETIAHTFSSSTVLAQLRRRETDEAAEARWSRLESSYECCGGGRGGYRDYADDNGDLSRGEITAQGCVTDKIMANL